MDKQKQSDLKAVGRSPFDDVQLLFSPVFGYSRRSGKPYYQAVFTFKRGNAKIEYSAMLDDRLKLSFATMGVVFPGFADECVNYAGFPAVDTALPYKITYTTFQALSKSGSLWRQITFVITRGSVSVPIAVMLKDYDVAALAYFGVAFPEVVEMDKPERVYYGEGV
jgi:hypothetical protein